MSKKWRPEEKEVEAEEATHAAFRGAANALSHVYAQAMASQKLAFHAGERHALENVYQWILSQHEEGSRVAIADIVAYLQNEIEHEAQDMSMSPRRQFPHQHPQPSSNSSSANIQSNSVPLGTAATALNSRAGHTEQTRSALFSNALSCPVRQDLMPYHLFQCPGYNPNGSLPNGNGIRNNFSSQDQDLRYPNPYVLSVDMHCDKQ